MGNTLLLKRLVSKIQKKIGNNETKLSKLQLDKQMIEKDNDELKQLLKFYDDTYNLKPTIILNSGRDNKYVYGKCWWYSNGVGSKKKGYRYFLGKMDERKSKSHWELVCIEKFYK